MTNTIFRALRHRNFRIFFIGQGISLVGTWMQAIAMSWLVYRLTGSPFLLGLVGFSTQAPAFFLSPLAGVLADRWNRHRVLVITQALSLIQALALAILTLTGHIAVWHIIALGIFLGCVNALDIPSRQSFIIEMVEGKEYLGNAIALNSLMFNAARLIGPSIAGIIIAMVGEGVCFMLNAVSFIAVIISLLSMRIKPRRVEKQASHIMDGLKEGFRYTYGFLPIRFILMLLGVVSLAGMSYVVLMPVFAKDILHGGPGTLGFLMASTGVGALASTIYLASRKTVVGLIRLIAVSSLIFSAGLIIFSLSRVLWFSFFALAVTGFGMMTHMASSNILLQTIVEDDKRGRVMSFYTMSFMGVAPFGSLLAGSLASRIGATNTVIIGGVLCILGSLGFASKLSLIRKLIHPIYRKMGIMPPIFYH